MHSCLRGALLGNETQTAGGTQHRAGLTHRPALSCPSAAGSSYGAGRRSKGNKSDEKKNEGLDGLEIKEESRTPPSREAGDGAEELPWFGALPTHLFGFYPSPRSQLLNT